MTTKEAISVLRAIQAHGEPDSLTLMVHPCPGQDIALVAALDALLGPGTPGESRDGTRWVGWGDRMTVFVGREEVTT